MNCGSNNSCGDTDDITTTLTTNANGLYNATNLLANERDRNFEIRVNTGTLPTGSAWTQTADPNGAPLYNIYPFTASAGKVSGSYDFGYYRSGAYRIGDTVFADWNGDGNQNTGEEGLSGIMVWLYNDSNQDGVIETGSDALVYTTTTNASGIYTFSNLYAGSYVVKVNESQLPTIWEDYLQTKDPDQNGVCTSCNEFGAAAVSSALPTNTAMDYGYKPAGFAKLGDRVWKDTDADGIQDPGETGIPNITVRIYQDDGQPGVFEPSLDALVAEVSTDANGNYLFEVLPGVKYLVYVDTNDPQMPTDTYGKKYALTTNNNYKPVLLSSGQIYLEADFGFAPGAYLGDFIWQDNDGDGSQDPGEPGISGVTVELYSDTNRNGAFDSEDVLYATTTTNASGIYSFNGIISGAYVVKVASPGNTFTLTGDPDAPTVPCSAGGCNGEDAVTLKPGQVNLSADFGYKPQYSLGDFVWLDSDKDGVQDPGEPGIGGVRLCLTSPCNSGNLSQTTTDSDGYYTFGGLNSGNYTVYVDIDTLPTDTRNPTYDFDGTGTPNQATINVNGNIKTADFGYFYSGDGSLSGTVFMDTGNDGHAFSSGVDLPIQNVPVFLYNSAGKLVASTLTGVDGAYTFNNLPTGQDFTVVVDNLSPIISGLTLNYEPDWSDDGDQKCEAGEGCNNQATFPPSASGKDFGFFALMDCGDLPDTYNYRTALAKEGPCHIADPNPSNQVKLGSQLDYESDGQPSAGANADDLQHPANQSNDEDGVAINFDTSWTPGPTGQTINITVNSSNAYVAAWFDWNNDGDFITANGAAYDTGEYINFGKLNSGTNQVTVSIPSGSACCSGDPKTLFARFRVYKGLTPPPIIAPTGLVANGEVEDYQWFFTDHPTSVNLLDFNVTTDLSKVILSWRTANELGAYGFNIYRSAKPEGEPDRINLVMIDSQNPGGIGITDYTYYDPDILPDVTYYYWLEFVDTNGSSWFGPVQITLGSNSLFLPTVRK